MSYQKRIWTNSPDETVTYEDFNRIEEGIEANDQAIANLDVSEQVEDGINTHNTSKSSHQDIRDKTNVLSGGSVTLNVSDFTQIDNLTTTGIYNFYVSTSFTKDGVSFTAGGLYTIDVKRIAYNNSVVGITQLITCNYPNANGKNIYYRTYYAVDGWGTLQQIPLITDTVTKKNLPTGSVTLASLPAGVYTAFGVSNITDFPTNIFNDCIYANIQVASSNTVDNAFSTKMCIITAVNGSASNQRVAIGSMIGSMGSYTWQDTTTEAYPISSLTFLNNFARYSDTTFGYISKCGKTVHVNFLLAGGVGTIAGVICILPFAPKAREVHFCFSQSGTPVEIRAIETGALMYNHGAILSDAWIAIDFSYTCV